MSAQLRFSVLFFIVFSLTAAHAEEAIAPTASHQALSLGHRGLEHFNEGRFALAESDFRAAEDLAHSPVFLLYQARSRMELGQLLSARELLQKCVAEQVAPSTPRAWRNAIVEAAEDLRHMTAEIPSVAITIRGAVAPVALQAGAQTIQVEHSEVRRPAVEPHADAELHADAEIHRVEWELDPGLHEITAQDASGTEISLWLLLERGQKASSLDFVFPEVQVLEQTRAVEPREPVRRYRSGAHAAFLLGASGWVFSAVAGTIAWSEARRIKNHCDGTSCRPEDEERAQKARRWANLSTAGLAVGAIGVGTGIGLLFYPTRGGGNVEVQVAF